MYRIIGADQREYGPISAEQLKLWIKESRLNQRSLVRIEGSVGWRPLSDFPEFAGDLAQFAASHPAQEFAPTSTQRPDGTALTSLVLGCVSLVCCPPLALGGIIAGIIALGQTKTVAQRSSRSLAIAGLVISGISILFYGLLSLLGMFQEVFEKVIRHY